MKARIVNNRDSFASFRQLLAAAGLPYHDLEMNKHLLISYYEEENLIGTGGLEIYEDYGLLRSVSVVKSHRGEKTGTRIVAHLICQAKAKKLKGLYLLTETAREFFLKTGFQVVDRSQVVAVVKTSPAFSHVCPTTATCMHLNLPGV